MVDCCANCCLRVMDFIFEHGNGWAFVQITAYGKGFVRASQDTWKLFEDEDMVEIIDADITSAIWFLTGICSGCICVIVAAAWTHAVYKPFTATISLLAFFIGYLMTRISMALPPACVGCYYTCYAENPENRFFDNKAIKDWQALIRNGRVAAAALYMGISLSLLCFNAFSNNNRDLLLLIKTFSSALLYMMIKGLKMHLKSLESAHQLDDGSLLQILWKSEKEGLNTLDVIICIVNNLSLSFNSSTTKSSVFLDAVTYRIIVQAQDGSLDYNLHVQL